MSRRKDFIMSNDLEMNYSTIFLLPVLEYDDKFLPKEFISAYIEDKTVTKIVLIFENTKSEDLSEILASVQSHQNFDSISYDDNNSEVVVKFILPKEYDIDFRLFKIGRYSKFSNKFKEVLLKRHGRATGNGKYITMIDTLYPDYKSKKFRADKIGVSISDLPNGEVMSIPDMDKELYFNIEELEKVQKYIIKE